MFDELPALILHAQIRAGWDSDSIGLSGEAGNFIQDGLIKRNRQVLIGYRDMAAELEDNILIISDGEAPWDVRRGVGIVTGILWSGVYHHLRISEMPHAKAQVIKNNTRTDKRLARREISYSCQLENL
jgi:hypothetical protein